MARTAVATIAFLVVTAFFFPVECVTGCNGGCHTECQTFWGLSLPGGSGVFIGLLAGTAAAVAIFKIKRT